MSGDKRRGEEGIGLGGARTAEGPTKSNISEALEAEPNGGGAGVSIAFASKEAAELSNHASGFD